VTGEGARLKRLGLGMICAALLTLGIGVATAQAAPSDPLTVFIPFREPPSKPTEPPPPPKPPPTGYLSGPCGLAIDANGRIYVSDYYHDVIDVYSSALNTFEPWKSYLGQVGSVDPLDGPCGLAIAPAGDLYVNDYHHAVLRFGSFPAFGGGVPIAGPEPEGAYPTGVAYGSTQPWVYVDQRTYVGVYEPSGAPVLNGEGHPLRIGEGSLLDGYGIAVAGERIYVPDAGANRVKVYEPSVDVDTPVATFGGPGPGFSSLRDTAIVVDQGGGKIYVVDNLQPQLTEKPEAQVDVFSTAGSYLGRLKYNIVDAEPPGLAVGNGGQVYVTSGNTTHAGFYVYGPNAETSFGLPATFSLSVETDGGGTGSVSNSLAPAADCVGSCIEAMRAGAEVTLTATPEPGSTFAGWSGGDCFGIGACTVRMDEAMSVTARFEAPGAQAEPAATPTASPPGTAAAAPKKRHVRRAKRHHRRHRAHHVRRAQR
jgi:hypothetical protein